MGPSGVGKTTFLASLAGKNKEKDGYILFNNKIIKDKDVKQISSYVYQDNIFVESLTVLEHINFMIGLKLDKQLNKQKINDILKNLNLDKNTPLQHLSGGEKKKITLGIELLNDRRILFCDEPTTGLDSYGAITMMENLENVAKSGKLVVVTIHQPSSQLFNYFTHIIILTYGKIFHQGTKEEIYRYFHGLNMICPKNYDLADYYIACANKLSIKNYPNFEENNASLNLNFDIAETKLINFQMMSKRKSFCSQLYWLIWRVIIDTKRNFNYHLFQYILLMVTATILATFYSSIHDRNNVQNVKGILFFFTSELIFTHTYAVINTFPQECAIFIREKSLYSTHSYFISKILSTMPRNIVHPFSFLAINFFFVDIFNDFITFFQVFGVLCVSCISGTVLGLCISAMFTSLEYMDLFIAPFELITMLAAGIFVNLKSLVYFHWIKYLSPFYYTYEALSILYWSNVYNCLNNTICHQNGTEILEELGFQTGVVDVLWDVVYMLLLTFVLGCLGFVALVTKRKKCTTF